MELASPSDRLPDLRRRMAAYQANGARLGWLLLHETRGVEVWNASGEPQRLEGLRLDLVELWDD